MKNATDLRTRYARETEVIKQVVANKGFSIFWATENQKRACAIARLARRGVIEVVNGGEYPWCRYRIANWK